MPAVATDVRDDAEKLRLSYNQLRSLLWNSRSSFDSHWRELAEHIFPRRPRFLTTDVNQGGKRTQKILDSTGTKAATTLQSGMHAGITSPARPWMKLTTPDPDLAQAAPVKDWLHVVSQRMLTVFLKSNLYNILPTVYGDMGVFGTAGMSILEDDKDLIRCYSLPIGSFAVGLNSRGNANTCVREYQQTVRQTVETFGHGGDPYAKRSDPIDWTRFSLSLKNAWDRGNYEAPVTLAWLIQPNEDASDDYADTASMPFESVYFELGIGEAASAGGTGASPSGGSVDAKYLRRSGFKEFPIMVPRWDVTGEDSYGTSCPGMMALPDLKSLMVQVKRKAQAIEKMVNPPVQAPSGARNQVISMLPGGVSYVDARDNNGGIKPIHTVEPDVQHLMGDIQDLRSQVERAFYMDLFLLLQNIDRGQMTAREVDERHEEKMLVLGPVLERTNDELLDPLIDRVYGIMQRNGLIPPAPPDLHGVTLKVEYTSILGQAQKMVSSASHERFLGFASSLVGVWPQARFKIDINQAIDDAADMLGVNPRLVVPNDKAEQDQAAETAAIQAQQKMTQMATAAKGAKDLAGADMSGDNALTKLVGANTGQ